MSERDAQIDFFPGDGFPLERTPEDVEQFEWIITSLVILSDRVEDPSPGFVAEYRAAAVAPGTKYSDGVSLEDFMVIPGDQVAEEGISDIEHE